jgi:hypothetical protein
MIVLYWAGIVMNAEPYADNIPRWPAYCFCIVSFLPTFGILRQLLSHTLMCSALLAAYGSLTCAELKRSRAALSVALLCLFLAQGVRHNVRQFELFRAQLLAKA